MDDPAAPRKRRRTRSSLVAEDDHTPERPNLNDILDHHTAIAAAANFHVDADTQLELRDTSEVTVIDGDAVATTEVAVIEASIIAATLDVPAELVVDSMEVDVADEMPQTGPLETDMDDDDFLEKALAAATSAALASTRLGQNGIHNEEPEGQPEEQPEEQQQQQQQEQRQHQMLQPSADYNYAMNTWTDPSLHLRIQSLPILENLAVQILETLAKSSYQETLNIVTQPESAPGQAYATLKALFDQTKRLYSQHEPFLSAHDLNLSDPEHRSTLRKANLATFISSVFGSQDVGFYHLNEYFLETFVQDGGRLLKSQGALFLDLKTQAYLSAMANGERTKAEILEDLFPDDLGERLMSRRPLAKQLTPSEIDFVKRARSRMEHLLMQPEDEDVIAALPDKYVWEDFLRDLGGYVCRHFEDLVAGPTSKNMKSRPAPYPIREQLMHHLHTQTTEDMHTQQPQLDSDDTRIQELLRAHNRNQQSLQAREQYRPDPRQEVVEKAARAAQVALQNDLLSGPHLEEHQLAVSPSSAAPAHFENPTAISHHGNGQAAIPGVSEIPYHTQSAPTQVLYERARLAATAKASPNNRRAGLPSQRRPWTTEEENALMAGLDRVKGPHWSQILAMFGAGGTINESLKDRNQVQLKDKARNLKLFFLKSGIEVPYYLQFVTGELKTRAPSQAAKNEAKERAKLRGDEDRAHVEGLLALAGGALKQAPDESSDESNLVGPTMAEDGGLAAINSEPTPNAQTASPLAATSDAEFEQQLAKQLDAASRAAMEARETTGESERLAAEAESDQQNEPQKLDANEILIEVIGELIGEPETIPAAQESCETRTRRSARTAAQVANA